MMYLYTQKLNLSDNILKKNLFLILKKLEIMKHKKIKKFLLKYKKFYILISENGYNY